MRLYMNGVPIDVLAEDHMGVLTQAEYDALPEEKAKQGLYVIPDDGGTLAGICDIYSTEEQVVGRWIDGRPVYQRTVVAKSSSISGGWSITYNDTDFDILVDCHGGALTASNQWYTIPSNVISTNMHVGIGVYTWAANSNYTNLPIYLTICYTKLSDIKEG